MKIFFDTDTQMDFMIKEWFCGLENHFNGALVVPDAEEIIPNLTKLTNHALKHFIPILGSVYRNFGTLEYKERESELARWGGPFLDFCMNNTPGQEKIRETLIDEPTSGWKGQDVIYRAKYIPNILIKNLTFDEILKDKEILDSLLLKEGVRPLDGKNVLEVFRETFLRRISINEFSANHLVKRYIKTQQTGLDQDLLNKASDIIHETYYRISTLYNNWSPDARPMIYHRGGVYFEKQNNDVFTNPATEKVLEMTGVKEAVVYGVTTDFSVKAAVIGMQKREIQCYVVEDAIKGFNEETTKKALEEMVSAGARFVKTKDVLEE